MRKIFLSILSCVLSISFAYWDNISELQQILENNLNTSWTIRINNKSLSFEEEGWKLLIKKENWEYNWDEIFYNYLVSNFFYDGVSLPNSYYEKFLLKKDPDFISDALENELVTKTQGIDTNVYTIKYNKSIEDILDDENRKKVLEKKFWIESYVLNKIFSKDLNEVRIYADEISTKISEIHFDIEDYLIVITYSINSTIEINEVVDYLWFTYFRDNDVLGGGTWNISNGESLNSSNILDPNTFIAQDFIYSSDKNNVYYKWILMLWANPNTLQTLPVKSYSKDENNVYFKSNLFIWADPDTFEILNWGYSKDKNDVYFDWDLIVWSDSATFEIVNPDYSKDKNAIYYLGKTLSISPDLFSFVSNEYSYSKDMKNVYLDWKVISWADPNTFEVLNETNLENKFDIKSDVNVFDNNVFNSSFNEKKSLYLNYSKDKNSVFYFDKEISWADIDTFKVLEWGYSRDKNNVYYENTIASSNNVKNFKVIEFNNVKELYHNILEWTLDNPEDKVVSEVASETFDIYDSINNSTTGRILDDLFYGILYSLYVRDNDFAYFKEKVIYPISLEEELLKNQKLVETIRRVNQLIKKLETKDKEIIVRILEKIKWFDLEQVSERDAKIIQYIEMRLEIIK